MTGQCRLAPPAAAVCPPLVEHTPNLTSLLRMAALFPGGGEADALFLPALGDLLFMDDPLFDGADDGVSAFSSLHEVGTHGAALFMDPGHSFAPAASADLSACFHRVGGGGGSGIHPFLTMHPLWPKLVDTYYSCVKVRVLDDGKRARVMTGE